MLTPSPGTHLLLARIHTCCWHSALMCMVFIAATVQASQTVIYPRPESTQDERTAYPLALLKLCESKHKHQLVLQPSEVHMQQGRSLIQLAQGKGVDIVWALTTAEREQQLLPIRIPLDRGLIGWRLLLIRDPDKFRYENLNSRRELSLLRAAQGHDWPDVDVLTANGFNLTTSTTYEGLFQMLAMGHVDYFPRAISEIWPELAAHKDLGLTVEPKWAIHYPAAFYFFVNKNNVVLAQTLEACLNDAIRDGSLRAIFEDYFRESINKAQLSQRRVISLPNPFLPRATPINKTEYWFSPTEKP